MYNFQIKSFNNNQRNNFIKKMTIRRRKKNLKMIQKYFYTIVNSALLKK